MTMPDAESPFAEAADLEKRWRKLDPDERERAETLLADASDKIRADYPLLWRKASERTLTRIVCQMVKRAMLADDTAGVQSATQTTGPFSDTVAYANPDGDLYLTSSERQSLGADWRRAFTIRMTGREDA
ncbi:Gp19/Gp15/Gp42 family protein [Bifidobacterium pullorum]|uniref:Gp19/Gp15/Gp42 family protein n=1 Tax=Bifidobacterium pullorum TaxID=78448 RepID=UPI00242E8994|nr:Gp19/Gp15/Gp42 family protein [Bifidobacterium pullorum]